MFRWRRWLAILAVGAALALPLAAGARVGGGQHYSSGGSQSSGGSSGGSWGGHSSGGGGDSDLAAALIALTFRYPQVMCPLLLILAVGFVLYRRQNNPTSRTQRAFEEREADLRTTVSHQDVLGWVNTLKLKDTQFDLIALREKVQRLFTQTQQAWFQRDMSPVRPFLSDAMFQRLTTQLALLSDQGVRNAISGVQVLDCDLIGLDQTEWYDTVHMRVRAQMHDADVPAAFSDQEALAAAAKNTPEPFVEVWSFVRKPGAQTRIGEDLYQGKCPNCGAPFKGGATNNCEFCGAIVNSGNYDWTLSEITQGIEHVRYYATVDGLLEARQADPALNLEILQDRSSLIFWKWIDAQSRNEAKRVAKLATPELVAELANELQALQRQGRRRVFLECAVGAVTARVLRTPTDGPSEAHVEIRWSARMGVGPVGEQPPSLPTVPQRWVFSLRRGAGAKTNTANGMSTSRCPNCNAPLGDSLSGKCDYCTFQLDAGERDWVLTAANPYERWNGLEQQRYSAAVAQKVAPPTADVVLDAHERERLLYMMAAIAAADGVVTDKERQMLQLFSKRWSVPWEKVEMALSAGPQLFDRLIPPHGSPDAELFLKSLVTIALVDGKIDRQERRMLETAAQKLGLTDRLKQMLGG